MASKKYRAITDVQYLNDKSDEIVHVKPGAVFSSSDEVAMKNLLDRGAIKAHSRADEEAIDQSAETSAAAAGAEGPKVG